MGAKIKITHKVSILLFIKLQYDLPPWLSGLVISGRGALKAWLAIRQGVGSSPAPAGMSSQVSARDYSRARYERVRLCPR